MVAQARIDGRIESLVTVINRLGLGETLASCDGHESHKASVFSGYSRVPLLGAGLQPIYREGVAMKNPAYIDLRPDPMYRAHIAGLLSYMVHQFTIRTYGLESEAIRIEVRPGDKFQIHLTHEWDPREKIYRSVHDLEMRVAYLKRLCLDFDPRVPWDKEIPSAPDFYENLAFLRQFSPAPTLYPLLQ